MTLGSFLTCSMVPSDRIWPWCSTVTLCGDVLDEFHVVLDHEDRAALDDAVEQFRGLDALADAHAGDRLVEHQKFRVLDQQHADLEPLLLAVAEQLGASMSSWSFRKIISATSCDAVAHRGVALEGQRAEHGAAARIGDLEILEHREILVDRRVLELAADAGLHDLVLLQLR